MYAFTDRPEIHSSAEDFAIEPFVSPVAAPPVDRSSDETVILIPLKDSAEAGHAELAAALGRLGTTALLFLRQIEEIKWNVEDGPSGHYLRQSQQLEDNVRHLIVIGQQQGAAEVDEEWLVFSQPVSTGSGPQYDGGSKVCHWFVSKTEAT